MKINVKDGKARIYTPYNDEFVQAIKSKIGGALWDKDLQAWVVPEASIDVVRKIMTRIYGESDIPSPDGYVSVELTFKERVCEYNRPVTILGKTICRAYNRDSGGVAGKDVYFDQGYPDSGGSAKNWTSCVYKGGVVILKHVPKGLAEKGEVPEGVEMRIIDDEPNVKAELEYERKVLQKRLDSINKILDSNTSN